MTFTAPAQGPSRLSTPVKVAAAVVVLVLLVAVVLVVVNLFGGGSSQTPQGVAPSALATTASSGNTSTAATGAPACPDNEGSQDRIVAQAPAATWRYQELVAYPVSPEFGPAVTDNVGRFCFQHSPTGALFMAVNAAASGSATSGDFGQTYLERIAADGPYRDQYLKQGTPGYGGQGVRIAVKGFKVLDYTGGTATIDLGLDGTVKGKQAYASAIYLLTWQNGDWKLRTDVEQPLTVSVLPDLAGYIPWGP